MWVGLRLPLWFGLPYFGLQLLFVPGTTPLLKFGSFFLTAEALDYSAAVSLRLLTLVLASLIFIVTTDPRDVVLALAQKLRVPYRFAFAVSVALRFLPILEGEAEILRAAQKLRGQGKPEGVRNRFEWYRRFAYSVFVITVQRVQTIAEAMENKAFGKHRERTYRRLLAISPQGKALMAVSGVLTVVLSVWR
jgi:energy-coupling factor transport system permease protein